jgi:hypothetical protein
MRGVGEQGHLLARCRPVTVQAQDGKHQVTDLSGGKQEHGGLEEQGWFTRSGQVRDLRAPGETAQVADPPGRQGSRPGSQCSGPVRNLGVST